MPVSKTCNVLFLCTGNSARSILAEALIDRLGKGRFRGYSAGSHPKGSVHPLALELLESFGYETDRFRSKGWEEFACAGAPVPDFVFTVCDNAAAEVCPVWPGSPVTAHWGVPDPAAAEGDEDARRRAFLSAYRMLEKRIRLFTSRRIEELDRLARKRKTVPPKPPIIGGAPETLGTSLPRTILVVEDEKEIRDLLAHYLRKEGFSPVVAPDGETAILKARKEKPDLVLLDILLPNVDGLEVLRAIRSDDSIGRTPVVMLTAKGDETDRVVGLELGADDYIPKPFSPREVVARIKAILRRSRPGAAEQEPAVLAYRELRMDVGRHEVRCQGKQVVLTSKEFRILHALLSSSGRVLSREAILSKVWGEDTHVIDRTVDVHIAKLRQKIPFLVKAIETVKDVGYKLREG
jgi:arsenate reductase